MKKLYVTAILALLSPNMAAAEGAEEILKKGNCNLMCHARDRNGAAPGWTEIAAKYANDKSAAARLEAKVRSGGGGSFGEVPMPATPRTLSDGEIHTAVLWVLNQK